MKLHHCLLLATMLAAGCGRGDRSEAGGRGDRPRVALIMKSLANEFFSTMAQGARSHQADHQQQYELVVNGIKDERDLSRQVALVEEMVASGVDAIVIAPADSKALVPASAPRQEARRRRDQHRQSIGRRSAREGADRHPLRWAPTIEPALGMSPTTSRSVCSQTTESPCWKASAPRSTEPSDARDSKTPCKRRASRSSTASPPSGKWTWPTRSPPQC